MATINTFKPVGDTREIRKKVSGQKLAGVPYDVGDQVGIPTDTIADTKIGAFYIRGLYSAAKEASLAITAGDRVYFNDTDSVVTTKPSTAAGATNLFCGFFTRDVGATEAAANFILDTFGSVGGHYLAAVTDDITIGADLLKSGNVTIDAANTVEKTITLPAAAPANAGSTVVVEKSSSQAVITNIAVPSGTINGAASPYAAIDAQGDKVVLTSNGNGDWLLTYNGVA